MIVLEDTRNQVAKHTIKHQFFREKGIEIKRTKLYVGDYTIPADQSICIDTKKDIQEIIGDICGKSHERFRNELIRAKESGIQLYVLVENTDGVTSIEDLKSWENPRAKIQKWMTTPAGQRRKILKYPDATKGDTLAKAMLTMEEKYGVKFLFCHPDEAGENILKLLTRQE